jgi:hypothetical protein
MNKNIKVLIDDLTVSIKIQKKDTGKVYTLNINKGWRIIIENAELFEDEIEPLIKALQLLQTENREKP